MSGTTNHAYVPAETRTKSGRVTDHIHVRNWDRFQHTDTTKRGRSPIWIKLYTELLSDEQFLTLTEHRRLLLISLWMEYARTRARLPLDTRSLTRRLQLRVTTADLEALHQAGFIDIAPIAARHPLDTRSATGGDNHGKTTTPQNGHKPLEIDANRHATVTPPSSLEEKREETTSTSNPATPDVEGWDRVGDLDAFRLLRRAG